MGRQRQRAHQLRRGAGARDRPGDERPPRVSIHARRRRRRRRLRIRPQPYVLTAPGGPSGAHPGCLWSVSQLHGAEARSSRRRSPRPLCVPTSHGPRQRRLGLRAVARARLSGGVGTMIPRPPASCLNCEPGRQPPSLGARHLERGKVSFQPGCGRAAAGERHDGRHRQRRPRDGVAGVVDTPETGSGPSSEGPVYRPARLASGAGSSSEGSRR